MSLMGWLRGVWRVHDGEVVRHKPIGAHVEVWFHNVEPGSQPSIDGKTVSRAIRTDGGRSVAVLFTDGTRMEVAASTGDAEWSPPADPFGDDENRQALERRGRS